MWKEKQINFAVIIIGSTETKWYKFSIIKSNFIVWPISKGVRGHQRPYVILATFPTLNLFLTLVTLVHLNNNNNNLINLFVVCLLSPIRNHIVTTLRWFRRKWFAHIFKNCTLCSAHAMKVLDKLVYFIFVLLVLLRSQCPTHTHFLSHFSHK